MTEKPPWCKCDILFE